MHRVNVVGDCAIIFEQFNHETIQWEIIQPIALKGITFHK